MEPNTKIVKWMGDCPHTAECNEARCWIKQVAEGAHVWIPTSFFQSGGAKDFKSLSSDWINPKLRVIGSCTSGRYIVCDSYIGPKKDVCDGSLDITDKTV